MAARVCGVDPILNVNPLVIPMSVRVNVSILSNFRINISHILSFGPFKKFTYFNQIKQSCLKITKVEIV